MSAQASEYFETLKRFLTSVIASAALRRGLPIGIGICSLYFFAQLSWSLWPISTTSSTEVAVIQTRLASMGGDKTINSAGNRVEIDIEALAASHLFGDPASAAFHQQEISPLESQAQKTALDVELYGIIFSETVARARAIVKYPHGQEQHQVGELLKIGSNVTLERVLRDKVIIRNQGRFESIYLFNDELNKAFRKKHRRDQQPRPKVQRSMVDRRKNVKTARVVKELYQQLLENPTSLAKLASFTPVKERGAVSGYRLQPRNKEQFESLGFQAGDVIIEVNGITLDSPSNTFEIYKQLRKATEGTFTVRRGGAEVSIMVGL